MSDIIQEGDALQILHRVVSELAGQGFVIDGELRLFRPNQVGHVYTQCVGHIGEPITRFVAQTVKGSRPTSELLLRIQVPAKMTEQEAQVVVEAQPLLQQIYTGDICTYCGSARMIRSGTCSTCSDCGSSGGCG